MPKVKICGNTSLSDAQMAAEFGADYLGLIFAESKRQLTLSAANKIIIGMPQYRNFVGVFFNQPKPEVLSIATELGIKILQFHGEETSRYCQSFIEKGFQVIKTFRIKDQLSFKRIDEYDTTAFLFDTFSKEETGGTGKAFDWNLIEDKPFIRQKLFLAGGLNPNNLAEAIRKVRPFAVDVASGVEISPGKKDPELVRAFITIAKQNGQTDHAEKGAVHS